MRNQVQLIAYADRLGGSLSGIRDLLKGTLADIFGGNSCHFFGLTTAPMQVSIR